MPPKAGKNGTDPIGQNIQNVCGATMKPLRPDPFANDGPDNQMESDFWPGRVAVVVSNPQFPLDPEGNWQRCWDEQEVVELASRQSRGDPRFHTPPMNPIQGACPKEKSVAQIKERGHNKAQSVKPVAIAIRSLMIHIIDGGGYLRNSSHGTIQKFFASKPTSRPFLPSK
jgi:hypothetical protein